MEAAPEKARVPLTLAIAVLVAGIVIAATAGSLIAVRAVRSITSPSFATPGSIHRTLRTGTWTIYQQTGRTSSSGDDTVIRTEESLRPPDVEVIGPGGIRVPVATSSRDETITRGRLVYTSELDFRIRRRGTYEVRVESLSQGRALLTRPFGQTFHDVAGLALAAIGGGLLALVGVVLLIVSLVQRSRRNRVAVAPTAGWGPPPASTPPGWYPDPTTPGTRRWWDGTRWTDHRA